MQGKASIQLPKQVKIQLKQKSSFGQLSFYTQCLRTATVLCDSNCTIYKLQRQQFLDSLTRHDKDSIEFKECLPIECLCCQQSTHVIANCPDVCYTSEYFSQISKINNLTQPRVFYQRKNFKSTKSVLSLSKQSKQKYKVEQSNYSPSNQFPQIDSISLLKYIEYLQLDSEKLLTEKVQSDKCSTIREQLLSQGRISSLQDALKAIPETIHEDSHDSIQSQYVKKQKPQLIIRRRTLSQNYSHSDSSLKLSPIFQRELTNPKNYLLPNQQDDCNSQIDKQSKQSKHKSEFSSYQASSGNQNQLLINYGIKDDIDRMEIFQLYYPYDNYDKIISRSIKEI